MIGKLKAVVTGHKTVYPLAPKMLPNGPLFHYLELYFDEKKICQFLHISAHFAVL